MTPAMIARMTPDQLRFYRLIEERGRNEDGSEDCVLACGHWVHAAAAYPPEARYLLCSQCLAEWIAHRNLHNAAEELLKLYLSAKGEQKAGNVTVSEVLRWSARLMLIWNGEPVGRRAT